jgi:hypothetical protein
MQKSAKSKAVDDIEDWLGELIHKASVTVDKIVALFDDFDLDGTGSISKAEFKKVLSRVGVRASDSEIRMLIKRFDADGDGRICHREFVDMAFPSAQRKGKRSDGTRRGAEGGAVRGGGRGAARAPGRGRLAGRGPAQRSVAAERAGRWRKAKVESKERDSMAIVGRQVKSSQDMLWQERSRGRAIE